MYNVKYSLKYVVECHRSAIPWIWISLNYFLSIFPPSIPIIKNINFTSCLNYNSRFPHCPTGRACKPPILIFSFPAKEKLRVWIKPNSQFYLEKNTNKAIILVLFDLPSFGLTLIFIVISSRITHWWSLIKVILSNWDWRLILHCDRLHLFIA